jgi:hypothetical protein
VDIAVTRENGLSLEHLAKYAAMYVKDEFKGALNQRDLPCTPHIDGSGVAAKLE